MKKSGKYFVLKESLQGLNTVNSDEISNHADDGFVVNKKPFLSLCGIEPFNHSLGGNEYYMIISGFLKIGEELHNFKFQEYPDIDFHLLQIICNTKTKKVLFKFVSNSKPGVFYSKHVDRKWEDLSYDEQKFLYDIFRPFTEDILNELKAKKEKAKNFLKDAKSKNPEFAGELDNKIFQALLKKFDKKDCSPIYYFRFKPAFSVVHKKRFSSFREKSKIDCIFFNPNFNPNSKRERFAAKKESKSYLDEKRMAIEDISEDSKLDILYKMLGKEPNDEYYQNGGEQFIKDFVKSNGMYFPDLDDIKDRVVRFVPKNGDCLANEVVLPSVRDSFYGKAYSIDYNHKTDLLSLYYEKHLNGQVVSENWSDVSHGTKNKIMKSILKYLKNNK